MAEDQRDGAEEGRGAAEGAGTAEHAVSETTRLPSESTVSDAVVDRIESPVQTPAPEPATEQIQLPAQVPAPTPAADEVTDRIASPVQASAPEAGTEQIPFPVQALAPEAATEQIQPLSQAPAPEAATERIQPLSQAPAPEAATERIQPPAQPPVPEAATEQIQPSFQPPYQPLVPPPDTDLNANPYAAADQYQYPAQAANPYAATEQVQPQAQPQPQFQPPYQQPTPYAGADQFQFGAPPPGSDAGAGQIQFQQPAQPLGPPDRWRAAAVAVLNLSGLGLGYVLMRRWLPAAACWVATAILLVIALPADPNGTPGGVLIVYLALLVLAAVHGWFRGLRTPLSWPKRSTLAAGLAVVLLAVPVVASVVYNQAQENAVQQMLLGRLAQADSLVAATEGESFSSAQPQYDAALATYSDLIENYHGSQAGDLVPNRLSVFYQTVAVTYAQHDYCDAIAPLSYLRGVPDKITATDLGSLATWPDDRLATSLYQCGAGSLGSSSGSSTVTTDLNELLTTFPASKQAAQVAPAVAGAISKAAGGIGGSAPCTATTTLQTLGSQAAALSGGSTSVTAALHKDGTTAASDVESGTYACGVSQYRSGNFTDAQTTMTNFVKAFPHDPNDALAQNFTIAAQIAEQEPAAGKVVPTTATGGDVSVTFLNDSPDPIQILYTGPVTGSITLGACGSCSTYSSNADGQANACSNSGIDYPQTTISLAAGTTYLLHQNTNDSSTTPNAYSEQYGAGNAYEDCAFETSSSFTAGL
jgi:hypothetical protein